MKGDTDTTAAVAGSIAEAFYGTKSIPEYMIDVAKLRMSPDMIEVTNAFYKKLSQFEVESPYKGFQL